MAYVCDPSSLMSCSMIKSCRPPAGSTSMADLELSESTTFCRSVCSSACVSEGKDTGVTRLLEWLAYNNKMIIHMLFVSVELFDTREHVIPHKNLELL